MSCLSFFLYPYNHFPFLSGEEEKVCEFMCTVCVHVSFEARRGGGHGCCKREVEQATWSKPVSSIPP